MTTDTALVHADFCTPRPGEDRPRIERYHAPRYGEDGLTPLGSVLVGRCLECGAASYDGLLRQG